VVVLVGPMGACAAMVGATHCGPLPAGASDRAEASGGPWFRRCWCWRSLGPPPLWASSGCTVVPVAQGMLLVSRPRSAGDRSENQHGGTVTHDPELASWRRSPLCGSLPPVTQALLVAHGDDPEGAAGDRLEHSPVVLPLVPRERSSQGNSWRSSPGPADRWSRGQSHGEAAPLAERPGKARWACSPRGHPQAGGLGGQALPVPPYGPSIPLS
jgi:hypothetical protein